MKKGSVVLAGAGCGDPELLTLKALRFLAECEVLVYDSLVDSRILRHVPCGCEKIHVGKRFGKHSMSQEEINKILIRKALDGKRVVRLKGGDPYVFGRGGEEFLALQKAGINCMEVPGITSAIAAPAAAGIPVTHRKIARSVTVLTGTTLDESGLDYETLSRLDGTLVILMGMHRLKEITRGLTAAGMAPDMPAAVIMEGGLPGQKCVRGPVGSIAELSEEAGLTSPAVIVIGQTASFFLTGSGTEDERGQVEAAGRFWERGSLYAEKSRMTAVPSGEADGPDLPLSGLRVGVTGTAAFAQKLSAALEEDGAKPVDMAFLQAVKTREPLPDLSAASWLVFTSSNGVRIFFEKMREEQRDFRILGGRKFAVIGPGTKKMLEEYGFYADYMPEIYDASHLAEGLTERILAQDMWETCSYPGKTVFLRAANSNPVLAQVFSKKGLQFADFPLYGLRVEEEKRGNLRRTEVDYLVFGSGMGVRTWMEDKTLPVPEIKYVCIGEQCAEALAAEGITDCLTGEPHTVEGILCSLRREQEKRKTGSDGAGNNKQGKKEKEDAEISQIEKG